MLRRVVWCRSTAILLLAGIGAGLLSSGLPEDSELPGYYDGDDDVGVTP